MRQATLFDSEPSTQVADEAPEPAWAGTPPERLHRIHVAPALGTGGSSFDVEGVRWRGDAGTASWKRSVAYRLALCWNLCEGWPTATLEDGVLRDLDDVSFRLEVALTDLLAHDPRALPHEIITLVEAAAALRATRDADYDDTDGRPHDCPDCLRKGL
jgi:hypothetical protein